MKSVYIETSIPSYLTARPSRDVRSAAWQQITAQWWEEARDQYEIFTSELVVSEAAEGHPEAAERRLDALRLITELVVDSEMKPVIRSICAEAGYVCPEICTPQELLLEEGCDV